ncbi:hypothetical protein OIU77_030107, partial [Salix suchowensis]
MDQSLFVEGMSGGEMFLKSD